MVLSPLYVSYSRQSSTWGGEPPGPMKAHTKYPRRAQRLPLKAQAREAQSQDGSSALLSRVPPLLVRVCLHQLSCTPRPTLELSQLQRHSSCADVQSQVKTLCLAFPPNFLACPSLNIDFAPPMSSLIRDGNRTANSGIE